MIKSFLTVWRRFADLLARINSFLLLSAVFLVAIVPLGLLFRLSGKSICRSRASESLWVPRSRDAGAERPF